MCYSITIERVENDVHHDNLNRNSISTWYFVFGGLVVSVTSVDFAKMSTSKSSTSCIKHKDFHCLIKLPIEPQPSVKAAWPDEIAGKGMGSSIQGIRALCPAEEIL